MSQQTSDRPDLRALSLKALEAFVRELGERPFRSKQLFRWMHQNNARAFGEMTDLPKGLRERLEQRARLTTLEVDLAQRSSDGTVKYRFRTEDGAFIESVYMPEEDRQTLCVSSQVGCAMGCAFCRTATMGFVRHLTPGEIVEQVYRVNAELVAAGLPGPRPLTNLVFMGMGEPLHNFDNLKQALELLQHESGPNFSHRHLTVSTSGLVPGIERLGAETEVKLAVSLNATTDEQRRELMPVAKRHPLAELLAACRRFPARQGRAITFEYVMLRGVNDSMDDARRLADLVQGIRAKVNLIAYNESAELPFRSVDEGHVQQFRACLVGRGLTVVTRKNRGRDILAACGQLAGAKRAG
ncbi:MAG TPA: 23S rRNA (adenine(2503)-C(2))-methyltransferase RlmN [Myxococcales bacterium]|nr:23S rRNA (adenine(2503)-C(2))-methyltransferase RlmN [Myxococcales bacterium]